VAPPKFREETSKKAGRRSASAGHSVDFADAACKRFCCAAAHMLSISSRAWSGVQRGSGFGRGNTHWDVPHEASHSATIAWGTNWPSRYASCLRHRDARPLRRQAQRSIWGRFYPDPHIVFTRSRCGLECHLDLPTSAAAPRRPGTHSAAEVEAPPPPPAPPLRGGWRLCERPIGAAGQVK
jgi:hypothetical protein